LLTCLSAIPNAFFDQTGFRAVVGKERRLSRHHIQEILLQGRSDFRVDLLTPSLEQGAVCGILHQRVLEGIFGIGRGAASEN
jgi:hypothetical protein